MQEAQQALCSTPHIQRAPAPEGHHKAAASVDGDECAPRGRLQHGLVAEHDVVLDWARDGGEGGMQKGGERALVFRSSRCRAASNSSPTSPQRPPAHQLLPAELVLLGRLGHQAQAALQAVLGGAVAIGRRQLGAGRLARRRADWNGRQLLGRQAQVGLLIGSDKERQLAGGEQPEDEQASCSAACTRLAPAAASLCPLPASLSPCTRRAWRRRSRAPGRCGPGCTRWRPRAGRRERSTPRAPAAPGRAARPGARRAAAGRACKRWGTGRRRCRVAAPA